MVVLMTCFSVLGAHLYAANNPANSDAQPVAPETAQPSTTSVDIDVVGTSGTLSFTGVEPGDFLAISGIGTATSFSVDGGSAIVVPTPPTPEYQDYIIIDPRQEYDLEYSGSILVGLRFVEG